MMNTKTPLATRHGEPIGVEVTNTFRVATVALGQLAVTPFRASAPDQPFEIDIVPVQGAYVVCLQRTIGGKLARGAVEPRWGRTNDLGWIVEPEEGKLYNEVAPAARMPEQSIFGEPVGGEMPVAARDQMLLSFGETYDLYWSFDRERFEEVAEEIQRYPDASPSTLGCERLVFRPRYPNPVEGLELLDSDMRKQVSHFLLRNQDRGYLAGHQHGKEVCLFDVTPAPLRAVYLCEFIQWWSIFVLQKSAADLATLTRARNIAALAESGGPDIDLDALFLARPGTPEREVLEHYRNYVWQCAANGVVKRDVEASLNVTVLSTVDEFAEWRRAAELIGRDTSGAARHPAFRGISPARLILGAEAQLVVLMYFDLYSLGLGPRLTELSVRVSTALEQAEATSAATRCAISNLLRQRTSHFTFHDALVWGTPDDASVKCELFDRYLTICADVDFAWWSELSAYSLGDWKSFARQLKWMASLPGGFAEAFKNFFEQRLRKYHLAQNTANEALSTFFRYHSASVRKFPAPVFEQQLPSLRATVRVDFHDSTITVKSAHDGITTVDRPIPFVFTAVEQGSSPEGLSPVPGTMTKARRRRFKHAREVGEFIEYEVELPVDIERARQMGAELPRALALACETVNTFFAVVAAGTQLSEGKGFEAVGVEVWYELAKNTLGAVDSLASLQDAMAPKIGGHSPLLKRLAPAITKATRAAAVVDALYNTTTGIKLLFSDDGDVAYELRQGRAVRAEALRVKGVLQLASAAGSGVMAASLLTVFGGASATGLLAAAAGPVGLAVAVCGVLITCVDGGLSFTEEFGERVLLLERAIDAAERKELAKGASSFDATRRIQRVHTLAGAAG